VTVTSSCCEFARLAQVQGDSKIRGGSDSQRLQLEEHKVELTLAPGLCLGNSDQKLLCHPMW